MPTKRKINHSKLSHCPELPSGAEREDYIKTAMTNWFSVSLLIKTGLRSALSLIFARFSDKRAILAASDNTTKYIEQWAKKDTVSVDYVADLGDGWDSTYSVAWCLAQPTLDVLIGEKKKKLLRGDILIMGGDQVYPFAGDEEYYEKLVRPYKAALPCSLEKDAPTLFAIPGNHDWYDGLTGFMRRFGQGSWLGGWKTQQKRSYFALKLPHGWWLWGIDTQLEAYIDKPQFDYFQRAAKKMKKGDRVILCVAEPSWIFAAEGNNTLQRNLNYLEKKIIAPKGGEIIITLAGDLHHFAHYKEHVSKGNTPRHKITCGGGGAFTHGTHNLPSPLTLNENGRVREYTIFGKVLPTTGDSRRMLAGNLLFPFKHLSFAAFIGAAYLLYAWAIADTGVLSDLKKIPLVPANIVPAVKVFLQSTFDNFWPLISVTAFIYGSIAFAKPDWRKPSVARTILKWMVGSMHGAAHILLVALVLWLVVQWDDIILPPALPDWDSVMRFNTSVIILGGLFGGFMIGLYLILSNLVFKFHRTEAFSAVENRNHKSFLRMVIGKNELVIYPVGLHKTSHSWRWRGATPSSQSWLEPASGQLELKVIGTPIYIKNK